MNVNEITFKVLYIATPEVNKFKIYQLLHFKTLQPKSYNAIGMNPNVKTIKITGRIYKLHVWDLNREEEKFRFLIPTFFNGADGVFIFSKFSIDHSLKEITKWIEIIKKNTEDIPIILIDIQSGKLLSESNYNKKKKKAKSMGLTAYFTLDLNSKNKYSIIIESLTNLMIERYDIPI